MTSATMSQWWYSSRLSPLPEVLEDGDDDDQASDTSGERDKSTNDDLCSFNSGDESDYNDSGGGRNTLSQRWRRQKLQQQEKLSGSSSSTVAAAAAAEEARERERQKALAIDIEVRTLASTSRSQTVQPRGRNGNNDNNSMMNHNNNKGEQEERSVDEYYEAVTKRMAVKKINQTSVMTSQTKLTSPASRKVREEKRSTKVDRLLMEEEEGPSVRQIRSRFESCQSTDSPKRERDLKADRTLQILKEVEEQRKTTTAAKSSGKSTIESGTQFISKFTDDGKSQCHPLLSKLYEISLKESSANKDSSIEAEIEGFLERLPRDKRRATLGSDWKQQYFVVGKGYLQSYEDQTKSVHLERIELFNGRVRVLDERKGILGVEDRNGHFVALRCLDDDAGSACEWERTIRTNTSFDFSRSFVTPAFPQLSLFSKTIVIDVGGASVRAGVATASPTLPQLFFPSVMAKDDSSGITYFGFDALTDEVRSRSSLSHPFAPSKWADKLSIDTVALKGMLREIFRSLSLDPKQYDIQLSLPRTGLSERTTRAVAGLLFDDFGVRSVHMGHQTTFALHSYNARSGIIVDMGERVDVVPVEDGYIVPLGVSQLSVGGSELRARMQNCLLGRNYSLTSFMDGFVVRYAMENLSYVAEDLESELRRCKSVKQRIDITPAYGLLKDLQLGTECFEVGEGLFKPALLGLDQVGIHLMVQKAIKECSIDVRREMSQSIFLAGGLTMIPGFKERLEIELEGGASKVARPKVHAAPHRYHAAYIGAMEHAGSQTFQKVKVAKEDWVKGAATFST